MNKNYLLKSTLIILNICIKIYRIIHGVIFRQYKVWYGFNEHKHNRIKVLKIFNTTWAV